MEIVKLNSNHFKRDDNLFCINESPDYTKRLNTLKDYNYFLKEDCLVEYNGIIYKAYSIAVFSFFIEPI